MSELNVLECPKCGRMLWKIYYDENGYYIYCLDCENHQRTKRPDFVTDTLHKITREKQTKRTGE